MDDFDLHRTPDDDLSFLGDLERGLDLASGYGEPAVEAAVAARPLLPAARANANRRPLLELFPPPSAPAPIARTVPPTQPPPPLSAGPASVRENLPRSLAAHPEVVTYETFYGLREKPFCPTSDPKFLYHSVAHDRAAQELSLSIKRRDGLAVLTGEAGIGKTMLCRCLLDRIDRRTFTSFVADPFVTIEELLKTILFDFGVISRTDIGSRRLAAATRQELTFAVHEFLLSLVQINGFAVVFIDEAHTVSPEMLAEVRAIANTDQALMGLVLIGHPELLLKLGPRKPATGAERTSVRARLEPLAEDEIAGYVLHRLTAGGAGRGRIEFDDAALALVYEISRGVPQLVNLLCHRALTLGFEHSVTLIDRPIVESAARDLDVLGPEPVTRRVLRRVLAAAAILVLVLMGAAAGAFVFRAQLHQALTDWAAPPPPPSGPAVKTLAPLETQPPPSDEPSARRGTR